MAVDNKVDAFVSIHHNATADTSVNFPIVYFHGRASENQGSVQLGRHIIQNMSKYLFKNITPLSLVSDHTIFPESGTAVLRHSYGLPGIIGEASFFSNPTEEERLKSIPYNVLEAQAYCEALEDFFAESILPVYSKSNDNQIPPFTVFQESQRMNPIALLWQKDYEEAIRLYNTDDSNALKNSYDLFTRSVMSFPDSWLAGSAHMHRAKILEKQNKLAESGLEKRRVSEYYITIE